jgi:DNA-directed RNA polymerase subunit alpha
MFSLNRTIGLPAELATIRSEGSVAVFEIKGLYPGYGHTMGNALRRIILSSLPGVAIVQVKITGADHEFSTLDGVAEDVLRITMNLQQVRARMVSGVESKGTISVTGPGVITARDIQTDASIEIANPDQVIAEITKKGVTFSAEITFASGVGFVPKSVFHKDRTPLGSILLDAVFTPIKKVWYDVENMRVGDRTDYNKVILGIETDGTLSPREALDNALQILLIQVQSLLNISDSDAKSLYEEAAGTNVVPMSSEEYSEEALSEALKTRIETLSLSSRTLNVLVEANIRTLGGLIRKTEKDILDLDGIGPKGVEEIKALLVGMNLKFKQ